MRTCEKKKKKKTEEGRKGRRHRKVCTTLGPHSMPIVSRRSRDACQLRTSPPSRPPSLPHRLSAVFARYFHTLSLHFAVSLSIFHFPTTITFPFPIPKCVPPPSHPRCPLPLPSNPLPHHAAREPLPAKLCVETGGGGRGRVSETGECVKQ